MQFMWKPLTDIVYPEIMLLASFEVRLGEVSYMHL